MFIKCCQLLKYDKYSNKYKFKTINKTKNIY